MRTLPSRVLETLASTGRVAVAGTFLICGCLLAANVVTATTSGPNAQISGPANLSRDTGEPSRLFELYRERRFAEVREGFRRINDFGQWRQSVKRESQSWPSDWKAAFLLEATDAALRQFLRPAPLQDWSEGVIRLGDRTAPPMYFIGIFDDARTVLARSRSESFKTSWHNAALSMLEGAVESPPQFDGELRAVGRMLEAYAKAIDGTVDAGRVRMARACAREAVVIAAQTYSLPTIRGSHSPSSAGYFSQLVGSVERAQDETMNQLRQAISSPSVAPEASLHLAVVQLGRGKPGDSSSALELLRSIQKSTADIEIKYLAHFFEGRALEAQGAMAEAKSAYSAALDVIPGTPSAQLALASILFVQGNADDADRLIQASLDSPRRSADPYSTYPYYDYRHFGARLDAMRGELK